MGGFVTTLYPLPPCGWRSRTPFAPKWTRPVGLKMPGGPSTLRSGLVRSYRSSGSPISQASDDAQEVNSATDIGGRLRRRSEMYERLKQSLTSPDRNSFRSGTATYNSIDLGHEFASVQIHGQQLMLKVKEVNPKTGRDTAERQGIGMLAGGTYHHAATRLMSLSGPQGLDRLRLLTDSKQSFPTAAARDMMTSMVPSSGGLGETVIELLSLNIPSLLSSLRRLAAGIGRQAKPVRVDKASKLGQAILRTWGSSAPWLRALGSDYLEVAFGLLPTIEVFLQLVTLFQETEDRVYGDSFRRVRQRNLRTEVFDSLDFPTLNGVNSSIFIADADRVLVSNTITEDLRVTVRATALGRESLLSDYYATDGKTSLVRRMGLLSPSLGWELLPFSWMADWFANFTAGLKRRSFFNDVYPVDYAYATLKYTHIRAPYTGTKYRDINQSRRVYSTYFGGWTSTVTTVRIRLDPFGNPWNGVSLDTYKLGILTALGLTTVR